MRAARPTTDDLPHCPRPGPRAGSPFLARVLLVALAALATISPALSGDREIEQRDADARQKLYVRRTLTAEAGLAPYAGDIRVDVTGTTAILSGTVPSAMLKQRALFLTGQVKGIGQVGGDDLQVVTKDGIPDLPSPFPEGMPPRATLAGNYRDGHTTLVPEKPDIPETEATPASPLGPVTLMAPVRAGGPAPSRGPGPVVAILEPRPLAEPPDLASAIEALRRKDERFRRLTLEVRQKTVYLRGTVARWDDVTELANAVRRLPGAEAVILDRVQVDRNGMP
jgi:osmotically-inducible protein OsmY